MAKVDNNGNPVMTVASNADGNTLVNLKVDPTSHGIVYEDGTTGSDFARTTIPRDANSVPMLAGVSSSDGTTPVVVYGNPATGALLTKST